MSKSLSKKQRCIEFFGICPDPSSEQIVQISKQVPCSISHVREVHHDWKIELEQLRKEEKLLDMQKYGFYVECPKCSNIQFYKPKTKLSIVTRARCHIKECSTYFRVMDYGASEEQIQELKKKSKRIVKKAKKNNINIKEEKNAQKQEETTLKSTLPDQITFPLFCKYLSYPGYAGLYQWQKDCYTEIKGAKFAEVKVPRDTGKSILFGDLCQYLMQYQQYDILYLGWTDRRKDVAMNIYNFFFIWDQIARFKSEYHFTIKNGGRFDCYLITSKDTLGKHSAGKFNRFEDISEDDLLELAEFDQDFSKEVRERYLLDKNPQRKLLIIIDDPIDDSFRDERTKEDSLERRFKSTIYNINPDKFIFTGTKKFEGDFFDFLEGTFKDKMVVFKRATHLKEGELHYGEDPINNPTNVLCPERFTEPDMPSYQDDIIPVDEGGAGKRDLQEIREDVGEYWWFAEYEQDPHPITGEVFDALTYEYNRRHMTEYDILVVNIDRATKQKAAIQGSRNKKTSYTGLNSFLREKESRERLVIWDATDFIDFEELLTLVDDYIVNFHKVFSTVEIYLVVEKQGGGEDFISSAKARGFPFVDIAIIKLVHSVRDKIERITDYLKAPINNARIKFLYALKNSKLVEQIEQFPHSSKLDGIDALATGNHVAEEIDTGIRLEEVAEIRMMMEARRQEYNYSELRKYTPAEKALGLDKPKDKNYGYREWK